MKTIVELYNDDNRRPEVMERAGEILKKGGLVAFPTETVYGLGGDALNPEASARIYAAKGRPSDNPLIVHIADMEALKVLASEVPEKARLLADRFWPGPLTMIMPKSDAVPYATTGGLDTVAIRMPSHPTAYELIRSSGVYIAAPSANTSGRPSPTTAQHVYEDLNGRIDMIIDSGKVDIGLESTIVDLFIIEQQHFLLPYLVYFRIDDITHLINIFIIDTVFFQFQNFRGQRLTQVQDGTSSEVREDYFIRHFLAHFIRSIYFLCFR